MDKGEFFSGVESEENEAKSDDEVDEVGFQIEEDIARLDGEDAPF